MNKNSVSLYILSVLFGCFLANVNTYAVPENIDLLKAKVEAYHDSGAYTRDLRRISLDAMRFINSRAKTNQLSPNPKKLAIVLDIDETSLSNYNNMVRRQFAATKPQLYKEVAAADFPAIKPTLALYHDALQHDVAVFFVTGRRHFEQKATIKNLQRAGYKTWSGLYFKPDNYQRRSVIPFKSHARKEITRQGYTIIASIGDQRSDLTGGYTETCFKLPNPFYYLP